MKLNKRPLIALSRSTHGSCSLDPPKSSKKISISKLHKKTFPLNLTLTWTPSITVSSYKRKYKKCPQFMNEFMDTIPKEKYTPCSKLDARRTFTDGFSYLNENRESPFRDLHPPVSLEIPSISYSSFKERRDLKTSEGTKEVYHPNTVCFSQRSKMVIYTKKPIAYLPVPLKNLSLVKPRLNTESFRLKSNKKHEKLQRPVKFEDKLKNLKEIIKDPLIYDI